MTMFRKVFGSQMAASEMPPHEAPPPIPEAQELPDISPPRSQPLFAPVPQILQTREEDMATQRAEREADFAEALRQKKTDAVPMPDPVAAPAFAPQQPVTQTPATAVPAAAPPSPSASPSPAPAVRPAGRARTRLLGFSGGTDPVADPMAGPVVRPDIQQFPTGWIVVADGPGKGRFFALFDGVSSVGRGEDQAIALNFGDMTISRENHAAIAYDSETKQFFLGHGGKSNIIRLNGRPVLSTEPLTHSDTLRIGETVLRFVALCGADFDWTDNNND